MVFALPAVALAQPGGMLTNGNAAYTQSPGPAAVNLAGPSTDFRPEGGATVDHLVENWWWYRVAGDARERPFGVWTDGPLSMTGSSLYIGSVATLNYAESRFNATYTSTLVDGASPGSARLLQSFQVNNPTAATLTISLFNYVDFDLNDQANDASTATLASPGLIRNVHGTTSGFFQADNPTNFRVTSFSFLLFDLRDAGVDNLNGTGLPFGPGDFTGAYQWDLVVPAFGSATVTGYLEVVPEPGPIALLAALAVGLGLWARRKKAVGSPPDRVEAANVST